MGLVLGMEWWELSSAAGWSVGWYNHVGEPFVIN